MAHRKPGFPGEYLWELDIAQTQLLALADAVPAEKYAWRPVETARPFSAVLVHVAGGNFLLLHLIGIRLTVINDTYGPFTGDPMAQFAAMIRKNALLEETVTEKQPALNLLKQSLETLRRAFTASSIENDLERVGPFFEEPTTVRRVYLRALVHIHEHMGQAIAYARSMGLLVPWPDPRKAFGSGG